MDRLGTDAVPKAVPLPIEEKYNRLCSEGDCNTGGYDFVRVVLSAEKLRLPFEALLCSAHYSTLGMGDQGMYLLVRRVGVSERIDTGRMCSADCSLPGVAFSRVVLNAGMTGSMKIDFLVCEMHAIELEMANHGTYALGRTS